MTAYLKILAAAFAASILWCSAAHAHVYWQGSFESGDFSSWSYIQGADTKQGGPGPEYCYVTTPKAAGIPAQEGKYIAHFERPASAVNFQHAKIFKEWSTVGKKDQFHRVEDKLFNGDDVSAVYVAWYYFPASYTVPAGQPASGWTNIFQFKEEGIPKQGETMTQNPDWWINVSAAETWIKGGGRVPHLFANYWGNKYVNYKPKTMPVPLGKWFEIRAKLHSGDRIEWYIDGKLFDTSMNSTYPVGRFFSKSTGWIFGVGHYQGIGALYVDHAQVLSLDDKP